VWAAWVWCPPFGASKEEKELIDANLKLGEMGHRTTGFSKASFGTCGAQNTGD
jgi:hypothetical protein